MSLLWNRYLLFSESLVEWDLWKKAKRKRSSYLDQRALIPGRQQRQRVERMNQVRVRIEFQWCLSPWNSSATLLTSLPCSLVSASQYPDVKAERAGERVRHFPGDLFSYDSKKRVRINLRIAYYLKPGIYSLWPCAVIDYFFFLFYIRDACHKERVKVKLESSRKAGKKATLLLYALCLLTARATTDLRAASITSDSWTVKASSNAPAPIISL